MADTARFAPERWELAFDPAIERAVTQAREPPAVFLKGPIPWPWIEQAMKLPGKALAVGLVLWREAGCRKRRTVRATLNGHGIPETTARRGLRDLEAAGLISVRRGPGRKPEVTILDAPAGAAPPAGA